MIAVGRRRTKRLPSNLVEVVIESLTHEGRGVARVEGKTVFIDGALPDERVRFRYTAIHRRFDEGQVEEVLEASVDRVEPHCPHFSICGGCSLQHLNAEKQIEFKQAYLMDCFQRLGEVDPEQVLAPLTGPIWGYRGKARLGVRDVPKKGRVLVGFRERRNRYLAEMDCCKVLHPDVGERLLELAELIGRLEARNQIAQIEVGMGEEGGGSCFS